MIVAGFARRDMGVCSWSFSDRMLPMQVDGNKIARDIADGIRTRVQACTRRPTLGVVVAEETKAIRSFVERKVRFGADIGIEVGVEVLDPHKRHTTQDLLQVILRSTRTYSGIVLQLPVPGGFELESLLSIFPLSHDVDVLGVTAYQQFKEHKLPFEPPVVAAMAEILHREGVRLAGMRVLVIGEGRLVGAPAAVWAEYLGAVVKVVDESTSDISAWITGADLIVCGAGVPGMVRPEMVKEGVIILDAGTSEQGGVLRGDADPACAEKARIFTPTPGGIGPITVAKVFENLLTLAEIKERRAK